MHFPTIALIGRYQDSGLHAPLRALATLLGQDGRKVLVEADTARHTGVTEYPTATFPQIGQQASLAIVMGGDGTMLGAARHLAPFDVPVVGINHGRLGFITDIPVEAAQVALTDLLQGRYETEKRMLLSATIWRGDQQMYAATALNDVVLNRAGRGG
jgi:NAD+ kinase